MHSYSTSWQESCQKLKSVWKFGRSRQYAFFGPADCQMWGHIWKDTRVHHYHRIFNGERGGSLYLQLSRRSLKPCFFGQVGSQTQNLYNNEYFNRIQENVEEWEVTQAIGKADHDIAGTEDEERAAVREQNKSENGTSFLSLKESYPMGQTLVHGLTDTT